MGRATTPRQNEVLELLRKGFTNQEIATALGVAPSTVKTHVRALCERLEADNRTELAGLRGDSSPFDERPAVAVLRFESPTGDVVLRGLSAGLADDLITLLSTWRWFPVIARTSSLGSVHGTPEERALALRARYVVHGAIRHRRARVELTWFLDDVERGLCLAADRLWFSPEEVFELEQDVASTIAGRAYPMLVEAEIERARHRETTALGAWTRTHRALDLLDHRALESTREARSLLDAALADDPAFLPALHASGLAWFQEALNRWHPDLDACRRSLVEVASRAEARWPGNSLTLLLRARAAMAGRDMEAAEHHARDAALANPSHASAHALLGQMLVTRGCLQEGFSHLSLAGRLSPRAYVAGLAISLFASGDHRAALRAAEQALLERPDYVFARMIAAASAAALGDEPLGREHAARLPSGFRLSRIRELYDRFPTGDAVLAGLAQLGVPE